MFYTQKEAIAFVRKHHPNAKLVATSDTDMIGRPCFGIALDGVTAEDGGIASTRAETWKHFAWKLEKSLDKAKEAT